jgi:hypothetical protein
MPDEKKTYVIKRGWRSVLEVCGEFIKQTEKRVMLYETNFMRRAISDRKSHFNKSGRRGHFWLLKTDRDPFEVVDEINAQYERESAEARDLREQAKALTEQAGKIEAAALDTALKAAGVEV